MARPVPHRPLPLPTEHDWASISVELGPELHGGHQSRVFAAVRDEQSIVAKLTDRRFVDPSFVARLELVAALAEVNRDVVGPLAFGSELTVEIADWRVAVYPLIEGRKPSTRTEDDVRTMATTLASLHRSLAALGPTDLPIVETLTDVDLPTELAGPSQLLHGDFSDANTILSSDGLHIVDFDSCGYGPVEFEVGNTLYMMLFDATISTDLSRYERFREWFVDQYRTASEQAVSDTALDTAIVLRRRTLERWLDDPETAPIGVRTASPEWHEVLRDFVRSTPGR